MVADGMFFKYKLVLILICMNFGIELKKCEK